MRRKICTQTQKYRGRNKRVRRILTIYIISCSSVASLSPNIFLYHLLSTVFYWLQLIANSAHQTSFSSSPSIQSTPDILIFLVGLCLNCRGCLEELLQSFTFFFLSWVVPQCFQVQRKDATHEIWKILSSVSEPESWKLMSHIFKFFIQAEYVGACPHGCYVLSGSAVSDS